MMRVDERMISADKLCSTLRFSNLHFCLDHLHSRGNEGGKERKGIGEEDGNCQRRKQRRKGKEGDRGGGW